MKLYKKIISHRGLLNGANKKLENAPEQINQTLNLDFDVEIDIYKIGNQLYTGHNEPQYPIKNDLIKNEKIWCHAKSLDSLEYLLKNAINCFWHENDNYTLTSSNYIWTYPKKNICSNSIIVLTERYELPPNDCYGICTDWPLDY